MPTNAERSRTRLMDFLCELAASRTSEEVQSRILQGLDSIVRYDGFVSIFQAFNSNGIAFQRSVVSGQADCRLMAISPGYERERDDYNAHYWRLQPPPPPGAEPVLHLDWRDWQHCAFYTELVRKTGSRYSLMPFARVRYSVAVHRRRTDGDFTESEARLFGAVAHHVSQLLEVFERLELVERLRSNRLSSSPRVPVTSRETDIVRLLSLRLTAAEMGSVLGISARTVEQHIAHLYEKLNAWDRQSLLRKALIGEDALEDSDEFRVAGNG